MRNQPSFVALTFLVLLCLVLTGAGCKKSSTPPDDLVDTDEDGTVTSSEIIDLLLVIEKEMTLAHVKPGEYSEVYLRFKTGPGNKMRATLSGPSVVDPARQTLFADDEGFIRFVWRVRCFGVYKADVFFLCPGEEPRFIFDKSVTVKWPDARSSGQLRIPR